MRSFSSVTVIGAGPAGLTAAIELAEQGQRVTVVERDRLYVGGLVRMVRYKGYRFDICGHRFFSKSREITEWWQMCLPDDFIALRRLSRIYYRGKFFDYPLRAANALFSLEIWTTLRCMLSYFRAQLYPIRSERSFADWVTNHFGRRLFDLL